jgi:hypothetical protein
MREHWRELGFWRRRWHERVSGGAKAVLAVLVLGGVVVGGWYAAQKLPSAKASDSGARTIVRTVEHVITLQTRGKVVVKRVPVIRRIYVANRAAAPTTVRVAHTVLSTQTVVRTIAAPVIRSRPETVTLSAHTHTVTKTRSITTTKTVPVTTVQWRVITVVEKQKPVTVTVTVPTAP